MTRVERYAVALVFCAASCGSGGEDRETEAESATGPDIILVSIDSLRADHVGCYGYERDTTPFLDQLAAEGVRFENAISTTSWTLPSHAAMFTGLNDSVHGLVDNGLRLASAHLTLAELLQRRGYHTAGFFGGPYLHPAFGLGQGFDTYTSCMTTTPDEADDEHIRTSAKRHIAPSHTDVTGPRTRERVRAWAERFATSGREGPYFLFIHLWDVHYDFIPPEEYATLFDPDYAGEIDGRLMSNPAIRNGMDARDLEHVVALYDGEIRFTDEVLRGMFGDLEDLGLLDDDSLIVITADHGEEFFEHGKKGHNKSLYDEVVKVPLIVRPSASAGQPVHDARGSVVVDQVQITDLMPTLAAAAGWAPTLAVQGRDLAPLLAGEARPARSALTELLIDRGELRALRSNEQKVIEPVRGAPAVLFDLKLDPDESDPIHERSRERQGERKAAQAELDLAVTRAFAFRDALERGVADPIELTDEMATHLRSLGYLGEEDE